MRIVPLRAAALTASALWLLAAPACSGNKTTDGVPVQGKPENAACAAVRPQVEGLYRAAAGDDPAAQRQVADNTEMVLWDCQRDPGRVAPCARAAASVAQLESQCVIPLDDDGEVEGQLFGPR